MDLLNANISFSYLIVAVLLKKKANYFVIPC